ncbi:S1C family serine protease [Tenacibaculum holothuriorum]|uniref:S1C family serine protease n=1 Tax=Tenacibaculum holothuriorum TaxID=1635173 RepID=UPI0021CEE9C6|nr:trypsin-like peptidase domain-containing protein [Tenacibaculum holothuriorum]
MSGRKEQKARTSGFTLNEFFQTDASINQGNSGGPMFNLQGEIIGVSNYIITESGGFQGIGFVATSNLAKKIVIEGNRRWTGISGYFLDPMSAWILNVPLKGGMLVESVVKFSPAYYAGLKGGFEKVTIDGQDMVLGGDIILSVNGFPLTRKAFERLNEAVTKQRENNDKGFFNQKIFKIKVLRGGKIEELTLEFDK